MCIRTIILARDQIYPAVKAVELWHFEVICTSILAQRRRLGSVGAVELLQLVCISTTIFA